jgi:methionyl-tRNA formyltransferase
MRIVFMGTPDFAVPTVEALLRSGDQVVGIVCQPDKPKGRGQELTPSPVKKVALREKISLLQPTKMKDPAFLDALRSWQPDLIVVAAFGRILPPTVLDMPLQGCINVHASLLPKYRGAGPIQWAIINGEQETGITTMRMDVGMDTGDILLQERLAIQPEETAGLLSPRLAELGARVLIDTIRQLKAGTLTSHPQDHTQATLAPLLKKEDGLIDWKRTAAEIANRIRGMTPWPGAYTYADHGRWIIWRAAAINDQQAHEPPGTIVPTTRDALLVATGGGHLAITELQPANGKRMTVSQYLAGHRIAPGFVLGQGPASSTISSPRAS